MPKIGPLRVEDEHDAGTLPPEEAREEQVLEHAAHPVERSGGRAVGAVQGGHGVVGAVDVGRCVDQEEGLPSGAVGRRGLAVVLGRVLSACVLPRRISEVIVLLFSLLLLFLAPLLPLRIPRQLPEFVDASPVNGKESRETIAARRRVIDYRR